MEALDEREQERIFRGFSDRKISSYLFLKYLRIAVLKDLNTRLFFFIPPNNEFLS